MASTAQDVALLEREQELGELESALTDALSGEGRAVMVAGDPGIGKTSLLQSAVVSARSRGFRVLTVRADALEVELSFGVCAHLFGEVWETGESDPGPFAGAAGNARPILGGAAGVPQAIGEDRLMSLVHGLYWLTANLADAEPLLLVVDDAHWADIPSLRFMHYLARRLGGLPVALLVAARPAERGTDHGDTFAALAAQVDCVSLAPRILSREAVSSVVEGELGRAEPEFARVCHELSGGNPFYLQELLRTARERGVEPSAPAANKLSELRPEGVADSVLLRLAGLGDEPRRLAEVAAVGGGRLSLRDAAELAGLDAASGRRAADALASAAILASGEPLRFEHPLVQGAVYGSVGDAERAGLHLRVAELLRSSGAGRKTIAVHLLNAERGGGDWVVDELELAAVEEMSQGSPEGAARFLRRALDEDPLEERRGRLLVTLGLAETEAGQPQGAERLTAAVELLPGPEERAGALLALGTATTLQARTAEATAAYERGLDEIADTGGVVALNLEAMFTIGLNQTLDSRAGALPRLETLIWVPGIDEMATGRALLAHAASERAYQGGSLDELRDLAARATAPGLDENDPMAFWAYFFSAYAYEDSDDFEQASKAIANALRIARANGSSVQAAAAHHPRSFVNLRQGNVEAAVADAQTTVEGAEQGWRVGLPSGASVLGEALLERGEIDRAAEACRLPGGDEPWRQLIAYTWLLDTRGRIDLARGDAKAALDTFLECGRLREDAKLTNPSVLAWRSGAALAASRVGERDHARELAETELRQAREYGAPRAIGVALLTGALVDGGEEAPERMREALAVLESSQARLEHARALVELGAALRRAGHRRDAREPLKEGLDMAHRCGAVTLAERARVELEATGARPRRVELSGVESLTPSERRIGAMAAEGMSNPQIAQALFLTRRTVEMHLSNAYRKLDISSREELPAALAAPAGRA